MDSNIQKQHRPHHYQIILGLLLAIVGIVIDSPSLHFTGPSDDLAQENFINPYEVVEIEGVSAIVWDANKKEALYTYNETAQLPLASLAKVLTTIAVIENINPDKAIAITSEAIKTEGDSGLLNGEQWRVEELVELTLLTSSNDGAVALASALSSQSHDGEIRAGNIFPHKILEVVNKIDMDQTFLINPSGLDISSNISGAYGSARDVAKLFSYAITHHPEIVEGTTYRAQDIISLDDITHHATNTNILVEHLPAVIASKTGYTDMAGGNLAVAFDAGPARPIVVVVLGSTREGRFDDVEKLIEATFEYFKYQEKL